MSYCLFFFVIFNTNILEMFPNFRLVQSTDQQKNRGRIPFDIIYRYMITLLSNQTVIRHRAACGITNRRRALLATRQQVPQGQTDAVF